MALAMGYKGWVAVAEANNITHNPTNGWTGIPVRSESVNRTDTRIRTTAVGPGDRSVWKSVGGTATVSGSFECEFAPKMGQLLKWTLGPDTTADPYPTTGTPPTDWKVHTFGGENIDQTGELSFFAMRVKVHDELIKLNTGCRMNTLTITCAPNEILTMTCDIIARKQENIATAGVTESDYDTNYFVWSEGKIFYDVGDDTFDSASGIYKNFDSDTGRLLNINSFEVSIANNLVGEKFYLGSGKFVDKIPVLLRNVTVSFEYEFEKSTLYDKIINGEEIQNLTIIFRKKTNETCDYYFQIRLPRVSIDEGPPELAGPEILTQSISATAERGNTVATGKYEIEIRLQNKTTSPY